MTRPHLLWQSRLILLLTLPAAAASTAAQALRAARISPSFALGVLLLCLAFALLVRRLRAATTGAALAGALILASLIFSTATAPGRPWRTALVPVLLLFLLTFAATRLGRARKEQMGVAEARHGRLAAQVAANLGLAALAAEPTLRSCLLTPGTALPLAFAPGLAALAEAAADTVSSELGQALGGAPRLITTLRKVAPGTDGGITFEGTLAGVIAAALVAAAGAWAVDGVWRLFAPACAGGVFGLIFDSLLGATLERRNWLNNDFVNFLSTLSAALVAALWMAI